nr:hypothetical protein [Gracilibacillus saliphilus]
MFKYLVLTAEETSLIFEVLSKENGWSFPSSSFKLNDKQGNTYRGKGGSSSVRTWGQYTVQNYEPLKENVDTIVVDFEWYDRMFQTEFSLDQGELDVTEGYDWDEQVPAEDIVTLDYQLKEHRMFLFRWNEVENDYISLALRGLNNDGEVIYEEKLNDSITSME